VWEECVTCSALENEVLIPLSVRVLKECITVEEHELASQEDPKEREVCMENIERLYDLLCKRNEQEESEDMGMG
jgi:hypothetical protein